MREPTRKNSHDPAAKEIERLWGDVPVIDAKRELRVFVRPEDVAKASRKEPGCCVFAQACKRIFNASKVLFFRTVAYVDVPQEDGKRRIERFRMSDGMRKLVEAFDRGDHVLPEAGFFLKVPLKSKRLTTRAQRNKQERDRAAKRKLSGPQKKTIGPEKRKFRDEPIVIDLAVRNGTGLARFLKKHGKRYAKPDQVTFQESSADMGEVEVEMRKRQVQATWSENERLARLA